MVWCTPASQTDLLTLFNQEKRFESQINGKRQESTTAEKQLDERPPKTMPLQTVSFTSQKPSGTERNCIVMKMEVKQGKMTQGQYLDWFNHPPLTI